MCFSPILLGLVAKTSFEARRISTLTTSDMMPSNAVWLDRHGHTGSKEN
jgi:hypothetical protein